MPGKNIKLLNGKPLIVYTFDAAKQSKLIEKTIISTDSSDIVKVAVSNNIEVPFTRPPHLAADHTPTSTVKSRISKI